MRRYMMVFASVLGASAVISGAFLAHQLKQQMPPAAVEVYETAVRYQFYHVFALLTAGILYKRIPSSWILRAGVCFIAGILLFSGSLFAISMLMKSGTTVPFVLGICTPLGGLGLIMGWIFLTIALWRGRGS